MTDSKCPTWCTNGTADHPCDGSHMRIDWQTGRVASGSNFPVVDERGAVFPAVTVGISATPSEGRGPHVFLFLRGPGQGDGQELVFPLDQTFGLAVDILDMYGRAIADIDRPTAPWGVQVANLEDIVADIVHTLSWHSREKAAHQPKRRREITAALDATDFELEVLMKQITGPVMEHDNSTVGVTSEPTPRPATSTNDL